MNAVEIMPWAERLSIKTKLQADLDAWVARQASQLSEADEITRLKLKVICETYMGFIEEIESV